VLWIWGGFVALAVVVVAVIVAVGGTGSGGTASTSAAAPVTADTSGSYTELVARGNDLYDQGIAAFDKNDSAGGEQLFRAAAKVYGAAWKKQPGDPGVGTDYAVALFYSRHHDEALKQIEAVLEKNPDFQAAHLNKGIFLQTEASEAKDSGVTERGADFLSLAKVALKKAVSIDPASDGGKNAAAQLQSL
jgi:tetratricopeptide (TPR) repeat protein